MPERGSHVQKDFNNLSITAADRPNRAFRYIYEAMGVADWAPMIGVRFNF
jgi:hypothetical protein